MCERERVCVSVVRWGKVMVGRNKQDEADSTLRMDEEVSALRPLIMGLAGPMEEVWVQACEQVACGS